MNFESTDGRLMDWMFWKLIENWLDL